ncbi:MAG: thymidylate kinase, partial [Cognaticolwellia sp.]
YQSLAMPLDRVMALNASFRPPDLCIFLDLDVPSCLARIEARGLARDRFETKRQLEEISAQYGVVLGMLKQRGDRILMLDAAGSIPSIQKQILAAVQNLTTAEGHK